MKYVYVVGKGGSNPEVIGVFRAESDAVSRCSDDNHFVVKSEFDVVIPAVWRNHRYYPNRKEKYDE